MLKFLNMIKNRIDFSIINTTPLGRWNQVGKSCEDILSHRINKKIRTILRKKQYNRHLTN
jgi:hypothetical protein